MVVSLENDPRKAFLQPDFVDVFAEADISNIDLSKKYRADVSTLAKESVKAVAEITGFNASFDLPSVSTVWMDLHYAEGRVIFEIDRNAKPNEINLRYARDRWVASENNKLAGDAKKGSTKIRSEYKAEFIADEIYAALAGALQLQCEVLPEILLRINFKDFTVASLTEEKHIENIPAGSLKSFSWPSPVPVELEEPDPQPELEPPPQLEPEPEEELEPEPPKPEISPASTASLDKNLKGNKDMENASSTQSTAPQAQSTSGEAKYATYSRSETDHLLKVQAESLASALSAKIASQQKVFQDALAQQEKSFSKLADNFADSLEKSRGKLESSAKQTQESGRSELENFRKELVKELDQYKSHLNKTVLPVAKFIEEKNVKPAQAQKELAVAQNLSGADSALARKMQLLLVLNLVVMIAGIIILTAVILPQSEKISELHQKVEQILQKSGTESH